jgi:arylsulfatase A-like enzyme
VPQLDDLGTYAYEDVPVRPNVNEENRSDKPVWVQDLGKISERKAHVLQDEQRAEFEVLLGFDAQIQRIYEALDEAGILNDTIIIFLTDNGYSYGSHNWTAKRCPYEECNSTPLFMRIPGEVARELSTPVSNVDLAPTIASWAQAGVALPVDGLDLGPLIDGRTTALPRPGVLLEWPGDPDVPAYWGLRTSDALWVEYSTGERELYDLTGMLGEPDPYQLHNIAGDERYADLAAELAAQLREMVPEGATVPPPPFVPEVPSAPSGGSPSPAITPSPTASPTATASPSS